MRRAIVLSFLFTILLTATAYASGTYAVVTGSRVNVRSEASMDNSNRLFQVDRGAEVEIHGVDGDFFIATVSGESGVFISRDFVRFTRTTGTVTSEFAWVYDLPPEEGGVPLTILVSGDTMTATSSYENWYGIELNDTVAFVEQCRVEIPYFVELPAARIGTGLADEIIANAMNYLGTNYLWGGTSSNGFDCSGFMVYLFSIHGIELNRSSSDQARNGFAVERHELEPGDLVFFGYGRTINHVGLYIGDGQYIHSSSERSGGVIISRLDDPHSTNTYITARRVL